MQEQEALSRMVSPGMPRPHIWRQGVLQIWITRGCDLACFGCTQGSNLGGVAGRITVEQFETAVKSLKGYFGVFGVFGGNPALHPQFGELCEILRTYVPWKQRGLWCNHPRGKIEEIRKTFNPSVSNLNVHLVRDAYDEFAKGWPASISVLKGLDPTWPESIQLKTTLGENSSTYRHRVGDARHSPPFVAMQDLDELPVKAGGTIPNTPENRWDLIADCDINKNWSAMIGVFRGELRGYFCEIAGSQAMLHQTDPAYPDYGLPVVPDWWRKPMSAFASQARFHCHACGIPLRSIGELAVGGEREQVSASHAAIFKPKRVSRPVELVQLSTQLGEAKLTRVTDYIENGTRQP